MAQIETLSPISPSAWSAGARSAREERLVAVETLLAHGPNAIELMYERAGLLDGLGRTHIARLAYLDVLTTDSRHAGALNDLGRLLDRTGFHTAARTAYRRAVDSHPDDPIGHGNLATSLIDAGETAAARQHYELAVKLDPGNAAAHQCLAIMLLRAGDANAAMRHGRIGFRDGASAWPYRGAGKGISVLVVHSALGGNVPIERFIDDLTFVKSTIVAEFFDPGIALPPHALVVNAIGDASRCATALRAATAILCATRAPILNPPARVAATTREANARVLGALAGVVTPLTVAYARDALGAADVADSLAASGFTWPVIVRAPGYQTGQHCVLVERPEQLAAAVASMPGDDLLVIQYIDVRARDATVRKYRVMMVDGTLLPLHLAISTGWMVHYFTADMAERPQHQAEEAAFLTDMRDVLGTDATQALEAVAQQLGLDYGGIDFALDAQRRVIVFEANATMNVPPSTAEREPYRRRAVERIETAVRAMLLARARVAARAC